MEEAKIENIEITPVSWRIERVAWLFVSIWTLAIVLDVSRQRYVIDQNTVQIAHVQAHDTYNKDLVYRRWVADQGGLYVPVTAKTPPNPHLSHLDARDVTTTTGLELTLVNPAYMTRLVHKLGEEQYGQKGHITSLNPIRKANAPDDWEIKALESFEYKAEAFAAIDTIDGAAFYRLMHPMVVEQSCLKCHETQGYELGDIRGGISVSIPMEPIYSIMGELSNQTLIRYIIIWIIGLGGIGVGFRQFQKRTNESDRLVEKLDRKTRMQSILHTLTLNSLEVQDLKKYYQSVHENLNQFREVKNLAIGLLNDDGSQLEFKYFTDEKGGDPLQPIPVSTTNSLAIEVIKTGQTLYLHGEKLKSCIDQKRAQVYGEIPTAWLGIPLSKESSCQGLVMLQFYHTENIFSKHDLGFLEDYSGRIQMVLAAHENKIRLLESEKRFRVISETANDAICMINPAGEFTFINPAGCAMFGYSEDELIGNLVHDMIMPEKYREMQTQGFKKFLTSGEGAAIGTTVELVGQHKDNFEFPIEMSLASVRLEDGWNAIAIIRDVTLRKSYEESQQKLSTAIKQSPVSIVITDLSGKIEYVNPKFEEVTGYSSEEAIGENPSVLNSREQSIDFYEDLWRTIQSGETWQGEFHNKKKDGELFWERASISPILDEAQQITHFVAVKEDITEQKLALDNMRKLSGTIEQDEDAIIITDALDIIEFVNQAFTTLTGYSREEVVGKDWSELTEVDSFEVYREEIQAKLSENLPWKKQRKTQHKDGTTIDEETIVSPLLSHEHRVLQNVVIRRRDITAEMLLEQQLKQSQKLESIGQLAAGIAHEINTPAQFVNDNIKFMSDAYRDIKNLLDEYGKFDASVIPPKKSSV